MEHQSLVFTIRRQNVSGDNCDVSTTIPALHWEFIHKKFTVTLHSFDAYRFMEWLASNDYLPTLLNQKGNQYVFHLDSNGESLEIAPLIEE